MKIAKGNNNFFYWIPSLYLLEGCSFGLITGLSIILFKDFGIDNTKIAFYTSLFIVPLFFKPIFAPVMENIFSKRLFILVASLLITFLVILLGLSLTLTNFFYISICLFFAIAFLSAIYDTNADGLYITELSKKNQAYCIGIRTISYQVGRLFTQGFIVLLASTLFAHFNSQTSWQIALLFLAITIFVITIYHFFILPKIDDKTTFTHYNPISHVNEIIQYIFNMPHLLSIVFFIFNFAENQLVKIVPLFLLDGAEQKGLGLTLGEVGLITGIVGIIAMLIGIFLSGLMLIRIALKNCLLPVTFFMSLANLGYIFLSLFFYKNIFAISLVIVIAQFSFGLSNGVYMYALLLAFGKGQYPMSLYAVATSLMMLSAIVGGAISGYMQYLLGYSGFFIWIELISIFVMAFCFKFASSFD